MYGCKELNAGVLLGMGELCVKRVRKSAAC